MTHEHLGVQSTYAALVVLDRFASVQFDQDPGCGTAVGQVGLQKVFHHLVLHAAALDNLLLLPPVHLEKGCYV